MNDISAKLKNPLVLVVGGVLAVGIIFIGLLSFAMQQQVDDFKIPEVKSTDEATLLETTSPAIIEGVKQTPPSKEAATIKVDALAGDNAIGSITYAEKTSIFIARRTGEVWTSVYEGSGLPTKTIADKYQLPEGWFLAN